MTYKLKRNVSISFPISSWVDNEENNNIWVKCRITPKLKDLNFADVNVWIYINDQELDKV